MLCLCLCLFLHLYSLYLYTLVAVSMCCSAHETWCTTVSLHVMKVLDNHDCEHEPHSRFKFMDF